MADVTIVNGVYKPTYNWGAPSCMSFVHMIFKGLVFQGTFTCQNIHDCLCSLTVMCKYLCIVHVQWFFRGTSWLVEDFPNIHLIKMSLPQAIVPWRSTVIQKGCVALRWLQRIDACHAMITFPVRGTFLGMCCLFFFVFLIFFGSMDFFGGFELPKNQWIWFKGPWREWKRCVFWAKKCYGLPVNFHSSNLVLWWLMFFLLLIYVYVCHHQ